MSHKVNHGPCRVCSGPILYLGALFCSPQCWTRWAERGDRVEPEPEPEPEPVEPEPVAVAALPEPGPKAPMSFLESPPDEPPKRRVYL